MIRNKKDYQRFIRTECPDLTLKTKIKEFFYPTATRDFIKALRRTEYHYNTPGVLHKVLFLLAYRQYFQLSLKTGISIPKNTCDKGLTLYHYGSIVVNAACQIGRNCCIMNNVNIGANQGSLKAPKIGNDVYIGPGAVIFGEIEIADGCYIGANAVVNKSILEPHSVVAGVPGKVLKTDPVTWWEKNGLKRD